jgi:hypothetical protein
MPIGEYLRRAVDHLNGDTQFDEDEEGNEYRDNPLPRTIRAGLTSLLCMFSYCAAIVLSTNLKDNRLFL